MKKKQILMSLLVLIVAGLATGCKNQSKSIEAPNKPPVVKPDLKEESNFEKAAKAQEELDIANEEAVAIKKAHEEAIKDREDLKVLLNNEAANSFTRLETSKNLDMAIQNVSDLEERVKLHQSKVKDKKTILDALVKSLTVEELFKLGKGKNDIDFLDAVSEEKRIEVVRARLEMSYDAAKASVLDTKKLLDDLESQILDREEKLIAFSVPGETSALAVITAEIESLRSLYRALMGKLNIETANQDVLARALEEL